MANICNFTAKITGEEKAVREFVQRLQWEGPYANSGLGRVYSFELDDTLTEPPAPDKPYLSVYGQGDCAWSIKTALQDFTPRPLLSETERLGITFEVFSSEPGIGFQEHLLVCGGEIAIEDCVDYEEHFIEGMTEKELLEYLAEHNLSREEVMKQVNVNGDYCVGGFADYGEFLPIPPPQLQPDDKIRFSVSGVYITPHPDRTWSSFISDSIPEAQAGVLLTGEREYPVQVYYARTDLNGSTVVERDTCANRDELVQSLNWIGQCGYTMLQCWAYDCDQYIDPRLANIFNKAADRRHEALSADLDELEKDPTPRAPLQDQIRAAEEKAAKHVKETPDLKEPDR